MVILLAGILISCNNEPGLEEVQFQFAPAFLHPSTFTIDLQNQTMEQYVFQNFYLQEKLIDSMIIEEHWVDTLIVHYQQTFPIKTADLHTFLDELRSSGLEATVEHREDILDGIAFRASKIFSNNDTVSLTSNRTRRGPATQMEYQLLDAFFQLAHKTIAEPDGISGVENIQDYFDYGLPIRKTGEDPLEYRIWGTLSGCRTNNDDLLNFLDKLPDNIPIILDLRNGSFSYCLKEVFEDYSSRKNIYLYGDRGSREAKQVMDDIKLAERNGEILSELRVAAYETHQMIYEDWKNDTILNSYLTREDAMEAMKINSSE